MNEYINKHMNEHVNEHINKHINKDMSEMFELNGTFYFIKRDPHELREFYLDRVWFMLNNMSNGMSYNCAMLASRKYANIKMCGCKY